MVLSERTETYQGIFRPAGGDESLYLSILSSLPSSVLVIDNALRVVSANRNFLIKSRKEEGEILGKRIGEIFPSVILYYTDLEEKLRKVCQTGRPFEGGEMEYRAPGLANRVYFYSLTPLKDKDGHVESVMLFMDDVTEKKSLGERVMRAERHLASVVESANDPIVSMDAEGCVMTWNTAAERILGFSTWEIVKKRPFSDLFSETDRPHLRAILAQLARGGEVQEMETGMRAKGGQELLISWRFSAMKEESGGVVALVGVGRDLTEKRRMELQLIQSAKMAALGEMAGGIAHEIRNPLAITSSAAQILLKKGDDPELRKECAQKIRNAAGRAANIIESLLRFARPSEGVSEPVDINNSIEDTLALVEHQISLQGIQIEKRFAHPLPRVKGNRNQFQQVFMNIILNAYQAMPEGGNLVIFTQVRSPESEGQHRRQGREHEMLGFETSDLTPETSERFVEIGFSDTGLGIPEENLSRIFDPFFSTMPVGQGTGLGLSIAYSIVQHHRGSIRVETQMGKGTTFIVSLPAPDEQIEALYS
ncbi:MAG: PAS domain-containing protein [candidate division NC10 bacterium]|nr:PAS domain-containing protein [candidate division NC10 bacterium]